MNIVELVNYYGFPIVAVFFWHLYIINYIVKEIARQSFLHSYWLIDSSMLDNDLIRLRTQSKTLKDAKKAKRLA